MCEGEVDKNETVIGGQEEELSQETQVLKLSFLTC
jgi:hypothetical protein